MHKTLFSLTALVLACNAHAVDGVILIDQAKALAGNITPGDAPGFPVTLGQPGSYRLSGNLVVPNVGTTGIVISSPGVFLDLNGFELRGPNVCSGVQHVTSCTADGLDTSARGYGVLIDLPAGSPATVAIGGGNVRGFAAYGVIGRNGGLNGYAVDRLHVSHSGYAGIGYAAMVTRSVIDQNRTLGIHHSHSVIGNTISRNGGSPIWSSSVRHNAMVGNGAAPMSYGLLE